GGEGARTPDLIHAMDALSQLSYTPVHLVRKYRGYRAKRQLLLTAGPAPESRRASRGWPVLRISARQVSEQSRRSGVHTASAASAARNGCALRRTMATREPRCGIVSSSPRTGASVHVGAGKVAGTVP